MGGRGSKSGVNNAQNIYTRRRRMRLAQGQPGGGSPQPQQPQQPPAQMTPGNALQTPQQAQQTLNAISQMTDDQLAQAVIASRSVDMPNFLNDRPSQTQKFVYQTGLNGQPTVMDKNQLQQFMQQNGIKQSQIMSRSVNGNGPLTAQQVIDIFKYSSLNYIGGKYGGAVTGAGTYFDMNGGHGTSYGGNTMTGILNPATARPVNWNALKSQAASFAITHPQFAAAVGGPPVGGANGNASIWALAMGYNVIQGGPVSSTYYNVIDRSAMIMFK